MANTEIFLRNIFGTTRPNIRPLVLALNITNDLLFEQHISMSDIKATKHIYPDVARLLHKKPETVYKSVIRLAHRCWDALVEQDLVLSYLGRSMKQEPDPSVFITYLAVYIQSDIPFFEFIERDPGFLFRDSPDIFGMSDIPPESTFVGDKVAVSRCRQEVWDELEGGGTKYSNCIYYCLEAQSPLVGISFP